MHFRGNAALWLQTYEALHNISTWPELCVGVFSKFNRDKYARIMDSFFSHKQTSSVDEYARKFEELMHKILLYNRSYDETFFVRHFLAGLRLDIRRAIKLHNPNTVDLAFSMAQTQEALLAENTSPGAPPEQKKSEEKPPVPSKFDSLRAQRRARGECYKCGEKFSPGHKCPAQVQLHVLEELLEALQITDGAPEVASDGDESDSAGSDTEEMMKLSVHAMSGTTSRRSMRLQGVIGKQSVLILIDSGSSSNFISQHLAAKLQFEATNIPMAKVSVAGGGTIACTKLLPDMTWHT
jgi:hypothetical protein